MSGTSDQPDDIAILRRLRDTPEIFEFIRSLSPAEIQSQKKLRDRFEQGLVRAALAIHDARYRAKELLPEANRLWLNRTGLEQSTAREVARHKARRFPDGRLIHDLCCGIGVDATALAERADVMAIDRDPAMTLRANWNAEIWAPRFRVSTRAEDVTTRSWSGELIHVDPDRRDGRARPVKRLEEYQPDLNWMKELVTSGASGAIKLGPAANFMQKFPGCEIELISLHGECREATVWFGGLAGEFPFRATVLPTGETISEDPLAGWPDYATAAGAYLFDPDPAVVRSGMLDAVARRFDLKRLDGEDEYLTGDAAPPTSFVRSFIVEEVLPGDGKHLKQWLRREPSSSYEIKCRRISIDTDAVRRQLPVGDAAPRTIVFARLAGKTQIVITRRPAQTGTALQPSP